MNFGNVATTLTLLALIINAAKQYYGNPSLIREQSSGRGNGCFVVVVVLFFFVFFLLLFFFFLFRLWLVYCLIFLLVSLV